MIKHKDIATIEVTPQHLTLAEDAYSSMGTLVQMNPPIRSNDHRLKLWWGLDQGILDILGSDHAPHTLAEKKQIYPKSPSGMPGVQTLVPIMLDHVNAKRLSLERFVDMTSAGPHRLFGMAKKGRLAVGYDADITVVDLKRKATITNDWLAYKCEWSPFVNMEVTGWPVGTIVRGQRVMWDGELVTPANGAPIVFHDSAIRP